MTFVMEYALCIVTYMVAQAACAAAAAVTAVIAAAAAAADAAAAPAAAAGQKKMIPDLDQVKANGQFIQDLLGIEPAVEQAMDIAVDGMNLKAPIPSSVTMQFRAIKLTLDNVSAENGVCYAAVWLHCI
jgi:hypothetical protein